MADFTYQARDPAGQIIDGVIDASSEEQAVLYLQQRDLLILQIEPIEKNIFSSDLLSFLYRPSRRDLIAFTTQLATLIEADVPLLESLTILNRQTQKESLRKITASIIASVEGGTSLSEAFEEHSHIFNRFFTSMVKVGEVSGKLQETLAYLADYLERSAALTSKIRGAVFYPVFVLCALVVVSIIMITTVIPQLLTIIKDSGVTDLPLPTRALIAVSGFFSSYFVFLIILAIVAVIGVYYYVRTERGRLAFDNFKINVPKFGHIVRNLYLARVAETLSTLIHSGVPILEGVEITANVVGNEVYKNILMEARGGIQSGGSLSATLQQHPEFPPLAISMIATGERTGRTDFMLQHVLKFYKTEADNSVQNISQLIEPMLILVLGLGIGVLIAAILLPIYSLINAV